MEILGILLIALIIIFVFLIALVVGIAKVFSPGTITFIILFIIGKKSGILKISWWWILLGLLIPF